MIYWRSWQKNKAKYWAAFDMEAPNVEVARIVRYPNSLDYRVVSKARFTEVSYATLASAKAWAEDDLADMDQAYNLAVERL